MTKQFIISVVILLLFTSTADAQSKRIALFIDCQMGCQMQYIREQIAFVDHMQNRQEADIYVLATQQQTGAGGKEIQLAFKGSDRFEGIEQQVQYFVPPNSTQAIERDLLVKGIKRGLLSYLIETDIVDEIEYSVSTKNEEQNVEMERDPWNYWVFNVGGNGWLSGEATFKRREFSGRFSANRISEEQKFIFSARYNQDKNTYFLTDGDEFTSVLKSYNFYLEHVKSVSQHWSVGAISRSGSSTFGNTDVSTTIKAAVEYNFFPYSEAQTRRFSLLYSIGPEYYDYTETTIYDKQNEWATRHGMSLRFQQTQKWGNISVRSGVEQYFHDLNLFNAYLNPWFEFQIFKGLRLNFGGSISFVNDRINIAKSDVSDEDILLQIKQRDTDFTYYTHIGINYRFGSKFNNFVNPRF